MSFRVPALALALLAVPAAPFAQSLGSPADAQRLLDGSDLVAIGRVISLTAGEHGRLRVYGSNVSGRPVAVVLTLDTLLKGARRDVVTCILPLADNAPAPELLEEGSYRIFFLKVTDDQTCAFTDPHHPALTAVPVGAAPDAPAVERLTRALVAVVDSAGLSRSDRSEAIRQLGQMREASAVTALLRLLNGQDDSLRPAAASALLRQNDLRGLPLTEQILLGNVRTASPFDTMMALISVRMLANSSAVPALARLLDAPNPATRRVAATGLRNAKSRSAVRPLLRALDDDDFTVRYTAVMGLAEVTGELPNAPSIERFRRSPDRYVQFWKDWAARRGPNR